MDYKLLMGLPNRDASKDEPVALDLEVFGAQEKRLHREGEGEFACLSIALGDTVFLIEDRHDVQEALNRIKYGTWVLHNATFDLRQLRRWADVVSGRIWDTMIVERDLFGGWYDRFSLPDLSRRWLRILLPKETREEFVDAHEMTPNMRSYAANDAVITAMVMQTQQGYAQSMGWDLSWYWDIDQRMIPVILDMSPVRIDVEKWRDLEQSNKEKFEGLKDELPFNPRSGPQVLEYLSNTFKINLSNTRKHTLERAFEVAEGEAKDVLQKIMDARGSGKLVSSYGESWLKHVEDGYVYPNWHIVGTETGRSSCSDPNMQQVPIRKSPEYRKAVIASRDRELLISDVNQQEVRFTAYFSQDRHLLEVLGSGEDTHLAVAKIIFRDDSVGKEDPRRRIGKDINLGLSYGLTASGLSRNTGISRMEAAQVLENYFAAFPGIKVAHNRFTYQAVKDYYVRTASGRPVYINPYSGQWGNNAINAPIQGTGGDHLKLAAVFIHERAKETGLPFCLNLLVHDELVLDVPKDIIKEYKKIVQSSWMDAADILIPGVPMVIDIGHGKDWSAKDG